MARQKRNLEKEIREEKQPVVVKGNKNKVMAGVLLLVFIGFAIIFFFFSERFTGFFIGLDEEIRYKFSMFVITIFLLFVIMVAFILYWYIKLSSFVAG